MKSAGTASLHCSDNRLTASVKLAQIGSNSDNSKTVRQGTGTITISCYEQAREDSAEAYSRQQE